VTFAVAGQNSINPYFSRRKCTSCHHGRLGHAPALGRIDHRSLAAAKGNRHGKSLRFLRPQRVAFRLSGDRCNGRSTTEDMPTYGWQSNVQMGEKKLANFLAMDLVNRQNGRQRQLSRTGLAT